MLIVATIGFLANLVAVFLLHKDSRRNLNIKAAYLHLLGDTFSSAAVIGGSIFIYYFDTLWIDPLLTVIIGIFIIKETYGVLRETIDILMAASPRGIEIHDIQEEIEKLDEVANIHHIHVWSLTETEIHFECHVDLCENLTVQESDGVRRKIEELLYDKFGITHVTIQMEYDACDEKKSIAHS